MNEKERIDSFLSLFRELENELLSLAKIKDDGFVSFSRALNDVYYGHKNPTVCIYDNYDFLKSAADLRNILSHENDVCAPTEAFLKRFSSLTNSIIHPYTCFSVATKGVYTCLDEDSLFEVMRIMKEKSLSHIPVVNEKGLVKGVFSRSTLFDYLSQGKSLSDTRLMKVKDFSSLYSLKNHSNEYFVFVSRNEKVDEVFPLLFKNKEHAKNLVLIFVTEHGKEDEKPLGIITLSDMARCKFGE